METGKKHTSFGNKITGGDTMTLTKWKLYYEDVQDMQYLQLKRPHNRKMPA
jgi:hypothetical protein